MTETYRPEGMKFGVFMAPLHHLPLRHRFMVADRVLKGHRP